MESTSGKAGITFQVLISAFETLFKYPGGMEGINKISKFLRTTKSDIRDWVDLQQISSRAPFISCIKSIYNLLIAYLPEGQYQSLQNESQNQDTGVFFANNFIPVGNLLNIPGRDVNFFKIVSTVFGVPIHGMMRADEILNDKQLYKDELDATFYSKLYSCAPVMDKLLALKIISLVEFEFIRDLLGVILQSEYKRYIGMVTLKDITSTTAMMHEAGYISAENVNVINEKCFNRTPIFCEICGNLYFPKRRNQKLCSDHSEAEIQQHRRKNKGAGNWGGERQGAGRKKTKR